jgi:hypothetical protein
MIEIAAPCFGDVNLGSAGRQSELSRHRDVVRALFFETVAELLVICWLALGLQLLLSQKNRLLTRER